MVNVRGIELSGERAAINPARDSARQTESAGMEAKKSKSNIRGQKTISLKRGSWFAVLVVLRSPHSFPSRERTEKRREIIVYNSWQLQLLIKFFLFTHRATSWCLVRGFSVWGMIASGIHRKLFIFSLFLLLRQNFEFIVFNASSV